MLTLKKWWTCSKNGYTFSTKAPVNCSYRRNQKKMIAKQCNKKDWQIEKLGGSARTQREKKTASII